MIASIAVHDLRLSASVCQGMQWAWCAIKMIVLPVMNRKEAMRVVEDKGRSESLQALQCVSNATCYFWIR
jgi:hypothetical protein